MIKILLKNSNKDKSLKKEDRDIDFEIENDEEEEILFETKLEIEQDIPLIITEESKKDPFDEVIERLNQEGKKLFEKYQAEQFLLKEKKNEKKEEERLKNLKKLVEDIVDTKQQEIKPQFYAALNKYETVRQVKIDNLGTGEDVVESVSGRDTINVKTLKAGTNISLLSDDTSITISGPAGSGEANTISNIGSGEGLFANKTGVDLKLRSLLAGPNISLTSGSDGITINSLSTYIEKSGSYNMLTTDSVVNIVTDYTGTVSVVLPSAQGLQSRIFKIKNSSSASIFVASSGSESIDGVTDGLLLNTQYSSISIMSTGQSWIII